MSNPEFRRNLWLSFSTHRLVAMPALLALTFLAAVLADPQDNVASRLYSASVMLFIFIVWLWGARNANAAIVDELRDQTWDQQRMSALPPWTMTWGKLFGATSFNWYGGAMCLAVIAASGLASDKPDLFATLVSLCAVGIMLHAALIALNLHTHQFESRTIQRGGLGWLAIVIVFVFLPMFSIEGTRPVQWWGMEVPRMLFWMDSALLFAGCATFAAWRVVCNALQVRTRPWAWPAFAALFSFYLAGFVQDGASPWMTGLLVSIAMTYAALFTEPNTLLRWRKLHLLQSRGDTRGWQEHLPVWPTTLALSFAFALMVMLASPPSPGGHIPFDAMQPQYALTLALMLLRDACILLFFSFAPVAKRAAATTMLYLLVLNMLLPFLAEVAGLETLRYFLLPFEPMHSAWSSIAVMAVHAAIALWLVRWRLHNNEQP